jgi:hypothetical protein
VRFIVDPLLINKSAPPTISVTGSVDAKKSTRIIFKISFSRIFFLLSRSESFIAQTQTELEQLF